MFSSHTVLDPRAGAQLRPGLTGSRSVAALRRFLAQTPVLVTCVLASTGCWPEDGTARTAGPTVTDGSVGDNLSWYPCGAALCSQVSVPLDDAQPEVGETTVAIGRLEPEPDEQFRGALFISPGGPGISGLEFLLSRAVWLRQRFPGFELVALDPRGVGKSEALDCPMDDLPEIALDAGGFDALMQSLSDAYDRCQTRHQRLLQRLGSKRVSADIERVRAALGYEQVHLLGISYGTRLALSYAATFPTRVAALVLDAPLPPRAEYVGLVEEQLASVTAVHERFVSDCAKQVNDCPASSGELFSELLRQARTIGVAVQFLASWRAALLTEDTRESLTRLLRSLDEGLVDFADVLAPLRDERPTYGAMSAPGSRHLARTTNIAANYATHCADDTMQPPDETLARELLANFEETWSVFAPLGATAVVCAAWPVTPDPLSYDLSHLTMRTLIFGGTADPLTPLAWAQLVRDAIPGAHLLTSEHYGHSALLNGSPCVDDALQAFLTHDRPLGANMDCPRLGS